MEVFTRLRQIVAELRQRCPWDRAQTLESLLPLTWEEVAELQEAIYAENPNALAEELGDLLLHVFFYAQLAEEKSYTNLEKVAERLIHKLIARHPHVYGQATAADAQSVLRQWENLKAAQDGSPSPLRLPEGLPPLVEAYRLQEKAAALGFDWAAPEALWDKLSEELEELRKALAVRDYTEASKELGDVLFVLVNLARHLHLSPEQALRQTNRKFRQRFAWMEQQAKADAKSLQACSPEELEAYWQAAKSYYP
ncbi:MAG: nucleoside triphosphate pyrophosphohydrolase [Bacteroidia bacterium]